MPVDPTQPGYVPHPDETVPTRPDMTAYAPTSPAPTTIHPGLIDHPAHEHPTHDERPASLSEPAPIDDEAPAAGPAHQRTDP
jgi:hypothetical protein